ncbi:MAG: NADPH:quinone reductase, partial [Acidimicrobiales bacterium]
VSSGHASVPIHDVYSIDEIQQAHADMEEGKASGKLVVVT